MIRKSRYLPVDISRAFEPLKICIGVIGVCVVFLYNTDNTNALEWLSDIPGYGVLVLVALLFACYPYSTGFCEDREYGYDRQMILRGSIFSYTNSKIISAFFSSFYTMMAGLSFDIAILIIKYGIPDINEIGDVKDNTLSLYRTLLLENKYVLFIFCTMLHLSMLAGILSVFGLMCSLYIKNRVLVYILPITILNIEDIFIQRMLGWERGSLFSLYCMGVTTLGTSLEIHSWQLYYFEVFILYVCISSIIYIKYKKELI